MNPMIIPTTYSSYSLVETKYKTAIEGIVADILQSMSLHTDNMFNIKFNSYCITCCIHILVLLQKAIYIYTIIVADFNSIIIIIIIIIIIMVTFKHICFVLLELFYYCRN